MGSPGLMTVPSYFIDDIISPACKNDTRIAEAFRCVPRAYFMDQGTRGRAYMDHATPIGYGQTISQPSLVAYMLSELEVSKAHRCLEVGAGSGYVSALLGKLADEVYGMEIIPELYSLAGRRMRRLMLNNVKILLSDGVFGYPEKAPYDRIIASAGAKTMPAGLLEQLADGGIMIIPLNNILTKVIRTKDEFEYKKLIGVSFVDFVGT